MINIINDFSFKFNSSVKLNFDGGDLTSDSGGLLIEEFMHVTGIKICLRCLKPKIPQLDIILMQIIFIR